MSNNFISDWFLIGKTFFATYDNTQYTIQKILVKM